MNSYRLVLPTIVLLLGTCTSSAELTDPLELRLVAEIDGSDRLMINEREVLWVHRHWKWPERVQINDIGWQPRHSPVLGERQRQSIFSTPVDFSTARMKIHQGRDTVVLEAFDDHVTVHFADSPNGRSRYAVTITMDRLDGDPDRLSRSSVSDRNAQEGLVGMAFVHGERTNVAFRYRTGRVLAPSFFEHFIGTRGEVGNSLQLNLRGTLRLLKELTVRIRHAGGSSNRGYATLSLDGKVIETLGDDRKKSSERIVELAAGAHRVEWQLSGGDIGHCLLEFADDATAAPLAFSHTDHELEQMDFDSTTRTIDVESEQSGWPIPPGW